MRRSRLRTPGPAPRLLAAKLGTTHPEPPASPLPSADLPGSQVPIPAAPKLDRAPSPAGGEGRARLAGGAVGAVPAQSCPRENPGVRFPVYWVLFTLIFKFLVPSLGAAWKLTGAARN